MVIFTGAIAITALVVGAFGLHNTNAGLIGTIANLMAENLSVSGNGQIDGNLVVGGVISKRKRDVFGGNITAYGDGDIGGNLNINGTFTASLANVINLTTTTLSSLTATITNLTVTTLAATSASIAGWTIHQG